MRQMIFRVCEPLPNAGAGRDGGTHNAERAVVDSGVPPVEGRAFWVWGAPALFNM